MTATSWQALADDVRRDPDSFLEERARRRLRYFTARMFPGYQTSPHILQLIDALEWAVSTPDARLLVTMPPRHSKSLHVSENLPAWFLGRFPDKRIIGASHTQELANTFSRRVRNKFDDPRWPFPGVRIAGDKAAVKAWDIDGTRGGYIAVGVGGSPTGHGGDGIVIDDPIKSAADADSETVRAALWEWYTGTLRTRLEPGGWIILTATRWHEDDPTGRLLKEAEHGGEQWRHLYLPAIDDETGEALWPGRWPLESLQRIKTAVGSRVWEAQYQGRPTPPEGGMFKPHWWQRYTELPPMVAAVLTLDSAFKTGVGNDWSVFALWGRDAHGGSYLVNVWRKKLEYPDLMKQAHAAHTWSKERLPGITIPLVIEDKASGQSAIQTLKKPYPTMTGILPALPVIPFPVKATESKEARAEGITPLVEGGRVFIPERAPWLDDWLTEHSKFPTGAHDDQVDTTVMGVRRTQRSKGGLV